MQQMAPSFISGAACKGNLGIQPDFLLPPLVGGTGQYLTYSFFGDLTVYQSGSNDSIHYSSLGFLAQRTGISPQPGHNTFSQNKGKA